MNIFDLYARIGVNTVDLEAGLKKAEAMAKSVASGIGTALGKINSVGETAFKGFMTSATAAAAAVGGIVKSCVEAGAAFEAQMSKVQAISGATAADMKDLEEKAEEMGVKTKFTATEAAEAYEYMAMASWKTGDMLGGIEGIMNLAAASGESLATTSDIVTDALTAFGLKAKDSTRFADVLAVASSNANTNVGMMGETFKYVAPMAGTLGYSIEDTAEAIGLIANSGIKASMAGTSLRQIMVRLSTDAGGSEKSLGALGTLTEKLGVQFYDSTRKARPFKKIIDEARVSWKKLNDQEKTEIATKIAGQEAISAWNALMDASETDVEKLSEAIADCDGSAKKMADTMMNNLSGAIEYLKSSAGQFKLTVYEYFKQPLTDFAKSAKESLDEVTIALQTNGLSGAFSTAGNILGNALSEGFKAAASLDVGSINNAIGAGAGGVSGWLSDNSDNINATIENAVSIGRSGFAGFVSVASTAAKEFGGTIVSGIIDFKGDIFKAGMELIGSLAEGIDKDAEKIAESAIGAVTGGLDAITKNLPKVLDAGTSVISELAKGLELEENQEKIKGSVESILQTFCDKFLTTENGEKIASIALNLVTKLGGALVEKLPEIYESLTEFVGGIFIELKKEIESTDWGALGKRILKGLFGGRSNFFENVDLSSLEFEKYRDRSIAFENADLSSFEKYRDGSIFFSNADLSSFEKYRDRSIVFENADFSSFEKSLGIDFDEGLERTHGTTRQFAGAGGSLAGIGGSFANNLTTIPFAESALARSNSSLANTYIAMKNSQERDYNIYLTLDGETVAEVTFDPLKGISSRKDIPLN